MEVLTSFKWTSNVASYKAQFEILSNRLNGLSEQHKLSYFLSSLKDEIRFLVRMFNPINLGTAFGLAKIQEEYLLVSKKPWKIGSNFLDKKPLESGSDSNGRSYKEVQIAKKISSA